MANMQPYRIKKISEYHHIMGLPKPEHLLICVINYLPADKSKSLVFDFYSFHLKEILMVR